MAIEAPRLEFEVLDRGLLVQDRPLGAYQSFPTAARLEVTDQIFVAFRQAMIYEPWDSNRGDHGAEGDVWLTVSEDHGRHFQKPWLVIDHFWARTNEHDALLTALSPTRLMLITRSHGPEIFGSFWSLSNDGGLNFSPRQPLDLAGQRLAAFGHLLADEEAGGWLLSFYTSLAVGQTQPGVARLSVAGSPLKLVGWIWQGGFEGAWLNETAMVRLKDGRLLAMIREEPCRRGLHRSHSADNGHTWSWPEPVGLFGEAPGLLLLPDGRLLVIFRGLASNRTECHVSLALSEDEGLTWSSPQALETYGGGRFHGGYGDLIWTGSGDVLAVYYAAHDGPPVVMRSLIRMTD